MESSYEEVAPALWLADSVECCWIGTESRPGRGKRVLPDGCADIIYVRRGGSSKLFVVGPMTRFREFPQEPGSCSVGIRFRPGMWNDVLRVNAEDLRDGMVPLDDLWGKRASELHRKLEGVETRYAFARLLTESLPFDPDRRSPLQRAIGALERSRGRFSLSTAAREAGFSARQFRRRCIEATGFSPKLLGRILRFRHASELVLAMSAQHAEIAYECGYADQSHLIADFREFAGRTPREMVRYAHTAGLPGAQDPASAARIPQPAIFAQGPARCWDR